MNTRVFYLAGRVFDLKNKTVEELKKLKELLATTLRHFDRKMRLSAKISWK